MRRLLFGTTALVAAACSSGIPAADSDGTWAGTITTESNVTTVINESGSVWGGTARLVEEVSIGVDAGEQHYMFGSIVSMAASEDLLFVLERRPPVLRVYDHEGRHVRDIGREGQGPGEFQDPLSMGLMPDGRVAVRDDRNSRMSFFSADGVLVDEWSMPGGFLTTQQMVITSAGVIYTPQLVDTDPETGRGAPKFAPYGAEGRSGEPVEIPDFDYEPPGLDEVVGRRGTAQIMMRPSIPFTPRVVSVLSPAGAMVAGRADQYRIEVRYFDGTVLAIERVVDRVGVSTEEREWSQRFTVATTRRIDPEWVWPGTRIPDSKPLFESMYADYSGRIWVGRQGPSRHVDDCDEDPPPGPPAGIVRCWEPDAIIDVFGDDGRYLGDVDFPDGFRSFDLGSVFIRGDSVLIKSQDEAGTIMVKRYRLALPGEE